MFLRTLLLVLIILVYPFLSGSEVYHSLQGINTNTKWKIRDFKLPSGYKRMPAPAGGFGEYLRELQLRPKGSVVRHYDGSYKKADVYEAVVDLAIGDKNLHQCADAVIRLRAEWQYKSGRHKEITFNFTNGFKADYSIWMEGYRIKVNGNKVQWVKSAEPRDSYNDFWKYLETVFTYAGTLSLDKSLRHKDIKDIAPGDVFIRGGSPGHAVIVVDVAIGKNGEKIFMIAQSYMPAQEIQVLKNERYPGLSPWYRTDFGDELYTPEWNFTKREFKSF